jgi:hypothetical protein
MKMKYIGPGPEVANIPGMGVVDVKYGDTITAPIEPSHIRFLCNHGFEEVKDAPPPPPAEKPKRKPRASRYVG